MHYIAQFLSVVFHPVFVPTYAIAFLLYTNPHIFGPWGTPEIIRILLIAILNTIFFPLFAIFLMRQLGFIESFQMKERQQRILVFIPTLVFWTHTFITFSKLDNTPILPDIILGSVIGLSVALVISAVFSKISLHAIGMGGLMATVLLAAHATYYDLTFHLCGIIILAGLVGSARLALQAHTTREVYNGYMVGFLCMALPLIF